MEKRTNAEFPGEAVRVSEQLSPTRRTLVRFRPIEHKLTTTLLPGRTRRERLFAFKPSSSFSADCGIGGFETRRCVSFPEGGTPFDFRRSKSKRSPGSRDSLLLTIPFSS